MSYCSAKVHGKTFALVEWKECNGRERKHAWKWIHDLKTIDGARVRGGSEVTVGGRGARVVSTDDINGTPPPRPTPLTPTNNRIDDDAMFSPPCNSAASATIAKHDNLNMNEPRNNNEDDLFSNDSQSPLPPTTPKGMSESSDDDPSFVPDRCSESSGSPQQENVPPRRAKKRSKASNRHQPGFGGVPPGIPDCRFRGPVPEQQQFQGNQDGHQRFPPMNSDQMFQPPVSESGFPHFREQHPRGPGLERFPPPGPGFQSRFTQQEPARFSPPGPAENESHFHTRESEPMFRSPSTETRFTTPGATQGSEPEPSDDVIQCDIEHCSQRYWVPCIGCYKLIRHDHSLVDCNGGSHSDVHGGCSTRGSGHRPPTPNTPDANSSATINTPTLSPENIEQIAHGLATPAMAAAAAVMQNSPSPMVPTKRIRGIDQRKERDRTAANSVDLFDCDGKTCNRKCMKFTTEERLKIRSEYLDLDPGIQRRLFICAHVNKADVKQRPGAGVPELSKRQNSLYYTLPLNGKKTEVCKKVFLTTLGFKPTNDSFVRTAVKSQREAGGVRPTQDKRGKRAPSNKFDPASVVAHIMSFHPAIPHYRRAHAPNRLYLPTDLNCSIMYKLYNEENPGTAVSRSYYSRQLDKLNIAFVKLGGEECDLCAGHDCHMNEMKDNVDHDPGECEECTQYLAHSARYKLAREAYQADGEASARQDGNDKIFVSVDMQKVILLPRLPESKKCFFTPRVLVFNETFAKIAKLGDQNGKSIAVIWHEGIRGRDGQDVASTYFKFLEIHRMQKEITMWMDNCVAQNKNWPFYSMNLFVVNSPLFDIETITLKYFEKGHSRMSADSVHAGIEKEFSRTGKVEDFHEFERLIARSNGQAVVPISMRLADFKKWDNMFRQNYNDRPKLRGISIAQFRRYKISLFYKNSHDQQHFEEFTGVKNQFADFTQPISQPEELGITTKQHSGIVEQLLPLMQPASRNFWTSEIKVNKRSDALSQIPPK